MGAEFTVSHIEEISVAKQVPQSQPILLMNCIVRGIAIQDVTADRHGSIGSHRAVIDQLFEIRAVVFVIAARNTSRTLGVGNRRLIGVLTRDCYGCRVLVKFLEHKSKAIDSPEDDGRGTGWRDPSETDDRSRDHNGHR